MADLTRAQIERLVADGNPWALAASAPDLATTALAALTRAEAAEAESDQLAVTLESVAHCVGPAMDDDRGVWGLVSRVRRVVERADEATLEHNRITADLAWLRGGLTVLADRLDATAPEVAERIRALARGDA